MAEADRRPGLMVGEAPKPSQEATQAERAAVDAALGGFPLFQRTHLLPLLQAVQARGVTLDKGVLGYLGEQVRLPFAEVYGVASFYALLDTGPALQPAVRLCSGVPCILAGAQEVARELSEGGSVLWSWFPCLGQCDHAPAALVGEQAVTSLTPDKAAGMIAEAQHGRN